jgi:TPR repeat protein
VKTVVALGAASAIILALALWIVWPSPTNERSERFMPFVHKSAPLPATIDPPFGFHWGDSPMHVETLLAYSSAEIVLRVATGNGETWIAEGLVQPGLKNALFVFEKNALAAVELQCQYDAWPSEKYRAQLEALRAFNDGRYGENHHGQPIQLNAKDDSSNQIGYSWRLGDTNLSVLCRFESAPKSRQLSAGRLIIRYDGVASSDPSPPIPITDHWNNNVVSPVLARKVQPNSDDAPAESDLGISSAKLLNTSDSSQAAFALQLAVKMQSDAVVEPTNVVVEVNFYDTLENGEIVLTDGKVSYDWPSRRDWKQFNPEMLSANYIRKIADSQSGQRYFGYIATVYYDGRLESVRAEPLALVNLFPVRTFISTFERAQSAAGRGEFAKAADFYRRIADQGNLFALENLAWFYAHGKGVEKDSRQAAVFYERAALQNTPRSLNALAWFLATCDNDSIRNGHEAMRRAITACELSYWQEWRYIDTLAAACAEIGDFKRAVEFEQQALQLKDLDQETQKKVEEHLALFRKRQPVRE